MPIIFMFPGQSSRYPGMLSKLVELSEGNKALVQKASDLLNRDLMDHYQASNENQFVTNQDVQLGVFLANHLFLNLLEEQKIKADYSLGLSLGEWNHLVHIGALPFEQALLAVEQRGLAYDRGPRGAMASFFPVALEDLEPVLEKARELGNLEVVNLNSPRQHVVAGNPKALDEAIRLADDELYIEGVIIEKQVPMHASVFAPVGQEFRQYLKTVDFRQPNLPYLPNRLGHIVEEPSQELFVELLSTHVHQPVLWRHSIDFLMARHPDAVLVEVGAKAVLHNLLDRKWHKGVQKFKTDSRENTLEHIQDVVTSLRALQLPTAIGPEDLPALQA